MDNAHRSSRARQGPSFADYLLELMCDDDRRDRLEAGVRRRRDELAWSNTEDDLLSLVQGRLVTEGDQCR